MRPYIILLFACLSFTAGVQAFSMASIIKQAEVIKVNAVTAATNSAITVSTTIRGFAANDPYQIKKLDVPKATFMTRFKAGMGETGGLKGLLKRNAWYAAWAASIAAAGWAIDELTDQVKAKPEGFELGKYYYAQYNSPPYIVAYGSDPRTACDGLASALSTAFAQPYVYDFHNTTTCGFKHAVNGGKGSGSMGHPDCSPNSPSSIKALPSCSGGPIPTNPVSDDALYDSLISKMLADPEAAAQAFMVPDAWPYPYPEVFPDTVPYIPGVTESDQELLDLYAQGLLQSTNPNAAHYVSPEKLAEIAALAGQLQQAVTPEGQVDAMNDTLKSPLTEKQLEALLEKRDAEAKKEAAAEAEALKAGATAALEPAQSALTKLADDNTWLENQIKDSATASPPSDTPTFLQWTWPSGRCQPFPFNLSIKAGTARADDGGAFCDFYNDVAHPLIFWFLNMLTGLMVFVMWSRTMMQIVGGR